MKTNNYIQNQIQKGKNYLIAAAIIAPMALSSCGSKSGQRGPLDKYTTKTFLNDTAYFEVTKHRKNIYEIQISDMHKGEYNLNTRNILISENKDWLHAKKKDVTIYHKNASPTDSTKIQTEVNNSFKAMDDLIAEEKNKSKW